MTFWKEVFTDVDGSFSFKRIQTALFTLLFAMVVVSSTWYGKAPGESITQLLTFLLTWGYTGIAAEKFTNRGITLPDPEKKA